MIVIFTDGENKGDCYRSLYNNIRRFGVGIYVAAVGTKNGSSIPSGGKPLKDEKDNLVISKLDDDFLQTLAASTKGAYYELNNEKNEINRMISDINNADGTLVDTRTVTVVSNKYYYFLGAALFLLLMDVLITIGTFRL